jgi:1-acyl-sn-glycerol-3-phosphate acyltransferase
MGVPLNAADRSTDNGGARNDAPQAVPPADGRRIVQIGTPRTHACVRRKGGRVSWRTVPAFAAGVLATLAAAVLVLCRGPARADAPATDRIVRWWAVAWLRAAGARTAVHGLEHVRADTAYVVVSNHQSNLDAMVHLRALPLSLRVLAMRELFRIWLLGRALRALGMIEVDRASPDFGQIDEAAARCLAAGHSLLVYPEGGTSPDGVIGEFKDGAFVIAVTGQVPVLPVAIDGTCRIWPPGRTAIHGGQVRIVVGSPLPTSGLAYHDIPALREQARDVICSARRALETTTS